jgi:hypothetical protein
MIDAASVLRIERVDRGAIRTFGRVRHHVIAGESPNPTPEQNECGSDAAHNLEDFVEHRIIRELSRPIAVPSAPWTDPMKVNVHMPPNTHKDRRYSDAAELEFPAKGRRTVLKTRAAGHDLDIVIALAQLSGRGDPLFVFIRIFLAKSVRGAWNPLCDFVFVRALIVVALDFRKRHTLLLRLLCDSRGEKFLGVLHRAKPMVRFRRHGSTSRDLTLECGDDAICGRNMLFFSHYLRAANAYACRGIVDN